MSVFKVNGKEVECKQDKSLMDFLRDDLHLTSVKDGCGEGACGTCTVIMNGVTKKACVVRTDKLDGDEIITTEGLNEREKRIYEYAFAQCGAVQCGFCIPGMVMCAKALIDSLGDNPQPTQQMCKEAIKNNICRCTGYKKIEEAIMLAAAIFRGDADMRGAQGAQIGHSMHRVDAYEKVNGTAKYCDDIFLPDMLYGGAVRSKYPRGKVLSIDLSEAEKHPGFVMAVTDKELPGAKLIGHFQQDWPVLIGVGETTYTIGDAIVLIAAKTKEDLEEIIDLVKVEQEELPPITSPREALKPDAPHLHETCDTGNVLWHEHLVRGDADATLATCEHVYTHKFSTPYQEHAFLEPECAVALMEGDVVRIFTSDQGVYQTQKECAKALGLPLDRVRVTNMQVGGGFGGKEDMSVQHHAAILTYLTGKPVKVKFSRAESLMVHPKRHPMEMEFTVGCDKDGYIQAMKATIIADTGAYASLGGPVLQRACTHAAGPYNYQVIDIDGKAVYTNNPPSGAFRGFGVIQSCFAMESCLNQLAKEVGISPYEIRYRNAIRPGQVLPNGQIAGKDTALAETLEAVKDVYESNKNAGIACGMKNAGLGVGNVDIGRCNIVIENGKAHLRSSASGIGQGLATVMVQIAATESGLTEDDIVHDMQDTATCPNSGNTTASRQTVFTGEATRRAAQKLKEDLDKDLELKDLEGKVYEGVYSFVSDKMGVDKENPVSHVAYSYATQVVVLDDDGKLKYAIAAHDIGQPINPVSLEGQIEGGVLMGMGLALTENYNVVDGVPTSKFGTLGLFKSMATPPIDVVIVGKGVPGPAFGGKGVGEICSIPTAPAVALAYEAWDGTVRYDLPLEGTPYDKRKKK